MSTSPAAASNAVSGAPALRSCTPVADSSPQASTAEDAAMPTPPPETRKRLSSPPATPDLSAGAALIVALLFGAIKRPRPTPNAASPTMTPARLPGVPSSKRVSAIAEATQNAMPASISRRGRLSESAPLKGATSPSVTGTMVSLKPAANG